MSLEQIDTLIIGGGVIGLAAARQLAPKRDALVLLEREEAFGAHSSSRNSEVVHAGLYYPPNSLKARLCVRGRRLLYRYAEQHKVPHRKLGKLIIAPRGREEELEQLLRRGLENDVEGLELCDAATLRRLEPALRGGAALSSRESGIIDSHQLLRSLKREAERAGALLALRSPVEHIERSPEGYRVWVGGAQPSQLSCRELINCAGLWAPALAAQLDHASPPGVYAKGSYFSLRGSAPSQRLIYPLPEPGGLGVHLTLDLDGRARFGPDVEWLSELSSPPDYDVSPERIASFERAIRHYWPGLPPGALSPDYSGIRVKRAPRGELSDFLIAGPAAHGLPGLVQLLGIESPGLTSSLAIAEEIERALSHPDEPLADRGGSVERCHGSS